MGFCRHRSIDLSEADDSSVASTISVDGNYSVKRPLHVTSVLPSAAVPATQKAVRFHNPNANDEHNHPLYKDECVGAWYDAFEYKSFRQSAIDESRALVQSEARNRSPFSYQRVLERTYETCKDVMDEETESYSTLAAPEERRHLNRWAEVAPHRLGLEKWALRTLVKEKQQRRFELYDFIQDVQDDPVVKSCTEDDRAEYIRKNCQRISRPSCMFAQALAQAYAEAASSLQ